MNNNFKIVLGLLTIFVFLIYLFEVRGDKDISPVVQDGVVGCYVARLGQDVYTLNILSQSGEIFDGKLVFKNFQKDSSSGPFKGTYKDGILLGDYSFNSEGTDSVMQVIFKKVGDSFVRGYGEVTEDGTRFVDLNNIDYDSAYSYPYKASTENCAVSL